MAWVILARLVLQIGKVKLRINAFPDMHTKAASVSLGTHTSVHEEEKHPRSVPQICQLPTSGAEGCADEVRATGSLALSICSDL